MKVFLFILSSSIVALLIDWYIYRRVIQRHRKLARYWTVGYLIYAFVVDTAVVVALLAYWMASDKSPIMLRAVMWIVALFFLNYLPKLTYAIVSPGDYVVQWWRRRRGSNKISHFFGYTAVGLSLVVGLITLHGITLGRTTIRVERVELEFEDLPAEFDGLRVVQFSDLHLGTLVNSDRVLGRMVDSINLLKPDIIINSGDIVNSHAREMDPETMDILGRMESSMGVYSVLGNHDIGIYIQDTVRYSAKDNVTELIERQHKMGWTVLQDSTIYLFKGGDSITLSGLNYPVDFSLQGHTSQMKGVDVESTYRKIPKSIFNITISHAPQLWNELLLEERANLTLSGHVHAMQSIVKLGRWRISPAQLMYERWSGLYHENGRYLYINDGIGCVLFHLRIGAKPEITLFTIRTKGTNVNDGAKEDEK